LLQLTRLTAVEAGITTDWRDHWRMTMTQLQTLAWQFCYRNVSMVNLSVCDTLQGAVLHRLGDAHEAPCHDMILQGG